MKTKTIAVAVLMMVWLGEKMQTLGQTTPPNMALTPAGSFTMGNCMNPSEGYSNELPLHTVYVSSFYMDEYLVTKSLWDDTYQWATNHGYRFDNPGSYYGGVPHSKGQNHPVHSINWYDSVKWCNARSEKEGRVPAYYTSTGQTAVYRVGQVNLQNDWVKWNTGYRLPTEAEWEKAARGGTSGHRFPWSDTNTVSHSRANYNSDGSFNSYNYDVSPTRGYHPMFNDGVKPYTNPVDYFAPNGYGLYDIAGNVIQWCWDLHGPYSSGLQTDPRGPTSGFYRVIRGGSWYYSAIACRSAERSFNDPSLRDFSFGFRSVLPSTAPDPIQVIETQPVQPTYSPGPEKEIGKDSLIVVTHGWQPGWLPVDITWLKDMTNVITTYLTSHGLNNWQVGAYRWLDKARAVNPDNALAHAKAEGINLGKDIVSQGFSHVHLIGHSAGAGLIQAASEIIEVQPGVTVHLTFLDPFVGLTYEETDNYGKGADWVDSYFSHDFETSGGVFPFTEMALKYAYNVNVTWLDTHREKIQVYSSTSSGEASQTCYEIRSSHGWPRQFYANTVPPATVFGSEGFGFPLSKEGGNWDFAVSQYKAGKESLKVLGSGGLSCIPNLPANSLHIELPQDFSKLPGASVIMNSPAHIIIHGIDFELNTASPAWLAVTLPITNTVNLVSFEAKFTSTNVAEGLLSVYWETNVIGSVDERVTPTGMHQYAFPLPETATTGTRTLGFRLDAFSAVQSSVTVSNVALGFTGLRDPASLSFVGGKTNGVPSMQLTGPPGFNYRVETSTNLVDWATTLLLVNTNGIVRFTDQDTTNAPARFYRAVAP